VRDPFPFFFSCLMIRRRFSGPDSPLNRDDCDWGALGDLPFFPSLSLPVGLGSKEDLPKPTKRLTPFFSPPPPPPPLFFPLNVLRARMTLKVNTGEWPWDSCVLCFFFPPLFPRVCRGLFYFVETALLAMALLFYCFTSHLLSFFFPFFSILRDAKSGSEPRGFF